jgi:uncharacterized protein (DUF2252 family)
MARNQNRIWTEEDDRRLLDMKAAGRSAVSIAAALRRSAGAVHGRASKLLGQKKKSEAPDNSA